MKLAAALDRPVEVIAKLIGVGKTSLHKYYKEELQERERANIAIGGALYKSAMNGNVAAQIFWVKCRLRWRESSDVVHSGQVSVGGPPEKKAYSVEEWSQVFQAMQ